MNTENKLPETTNNFACFTSKFKPCTPQENYHEGKSVKGRVLSFGHLIASPVSIPAALLVRIVSIAAALLVFLVSIVGLLEFKDDKVDLLKKAAFSLIDHTLNFLSSPLTLVAERVRFIGGIFHPRVVYYVKYNYDKNNVVV